MNTKGKYPSMNIVDLREGGIVPHAPIHHSTHMTDIHDKINPPDIGSGKWPSRIKWASITILAILVGWLVLNNI